MEIPLKTKQFDDTVDTKVKDIIDEWRTTRANAIEKEGRDPGAAFAMNNVTFEGNGVLIVAKDTVSDTEPLCLTIGPTGNKIELLPCFESWVPATLAPGWETGAVVLRETKRHTRWSVGPCTTDGTVERLYVFLNFVEPVGVLYYNYHPYLTHYVSICNRDSGTMNVTLGKYSATGPRCMLQQMDGVRAGRCYDGGSTTLQPGGETQIYPCMREWYQFVSFGDGHFAPVGAMYSTVPFHIVKQIHALGHDHIPYMCLGVLERGDKDEMDWEDEAYEKSILNLTSHTSKPHIRHQEEPSEEFEPLSSFNGVGVVTTQCNNIGAVIEWVFVPFIHDDDEEKDETSAAANGSTTTGSNNSNEDQPEAAVVLLENETVADDQEL